MWIFIFRQEIFECAKEIYGKEIDEAALCRICGAASEELVARLRRGTKLEEIRESFVMAVGMIALSMYISAPCAGSISSFRAGSVSATVGGSGASAGALREQGERLLAAHLRDCGFDFRAVGG